MASSARRTDHWVPSPVLLTRFLLSPKERSNEHYYRTDEGRPREKGEPGGNELGPDHPDRGQPGHFYQDRLREQACGRVSQHLVHFSRVQHLHEGQRPARRSLHHQPHLRYLRRQPRHLRHLRAEHGVWGEAASDRGVDRQSRRSCRVHVRPQYLPGQSGRRGFLRADGQGNQSQGLGQSAIDGGAARQCARLPHHRRHHDRAQSRSPELSIAKPWS